MTQNSKNVLEPARVFNRYAALLGASFQGYWLAASVYLVVDAQLSPLQLILLGTALEITILLAEIPTGVIADTLSRKASIVIALVLTAAAFLLSSITISFSALLIAMVLWGIGFTFSSGSDIAWLTDELIHRGHGQRQIDVALTAKARWQQRGGAAGLAAFGIFGWLTSPALAMAAAGVLLFWLAVWVSVRFTEDGFRPTRPTGVADGFQRSLGVLKTGVASVRTDHTVLVLLAVTVLFNLGAEAVDRLSELRLIDLGLPGDASPVLFFTALGIIGLIAGAGLLRLVEPHISDTAGGAAEQSPDGGGSRRIYGAMSLLAAIGALILSGAPTATIGALGVFLARGLAWSVLPVVSSVWINRSTGSESRATVQSFLGQATAAGQILGGLMLGAIASFAGLTVAIAVSAALFALSGCVILWAPTRRSRA